MDIMSAKKAPGHRTSVHRRSRSVGDPWDPSRGERGQGLSDQRSGPPGPALGGRDPREGRSPSPAAQDLQPREVLKHLFRGVEHVHPVRSAHPRVGQAQRQVLLAEGLQEQQSARCQMVHHPLMDPGTDLRCEVGVYQGRGVVMLRSASRVLISPTSYRSCTPCSAASVIALSRPASLMSQAVTCRP